MQYTLEKYKEYAEELLYCLVKALERCAELVVHAVEGSRGVAFVEPHVRSRDLAFLDDVHVAQARSGTR